MRDVGLVGVNLLVLPEKFCGATYFAKMSDVFAKIALDFFRGRLEDVRD